MLSPRLTELSSHELSPALLRHAVPPLAGPVRLFRVSRAGDFDGQRVQRGDVVVCTPRAEPDTQVVLVARDGSQPMLGHLREDGLHGAKGQPCSPVRWRVGGAVLAIMPEAVLEAAVAAAPAVASPAATQPAQLALFAA